MQVEETAKVSVLFHKEDEGRVKNSENILKIRLTVNECACRIGVRL